MAGIEKDHWLWNTRANDTGSIVDVSLGLFNQWLGGEFMAFCQITQLTTARASTYFSVSSTLRPGRDHHWVVGYRLSGRSFTQHPSGVFTDTAFQCL
jgi:hypothetical protein